MSGEPIPLHPERIEERGDFPEHSDTPQPLRSGIEARELARQRLAEWRATHGDLI